MTSAESLDAVVVGSGPNGLAAAITLAEAGCSVLVVEGAGTVGGGMRSAELTLPGLVHDVCSAFHPLGIVSPFFAGLDLARHGLEWVHPDVPLAHPLDDGSVVLLERSVEATAQGLGADAEAYRKVMGWLVRSAEDLIPEILGPLRPPRHPFTMARFGLTGIGSAQGFARRHYDGSRAQALTAGAAAHAMLPLTRWPTAAFGLVLTILAHAVGWPVARGGSQRIADALVAHLTQLGGRIETGWWVRSVDELPPAKVVLLDVTPRQVIAMAGHRLPARYRRALERYRYGPGVFKIDWAVEGAVPWRAPEAARAGTVHLGGTLPEIAAAEAATCKGVHPERPFVLLGQQGAFDTSRAAGEVAPVWAYCHVPHGSDRDMTATVEAQVERFAPGFRDRIVGRAVRNAAAFEAYNPNYVGGDINGGVQDLGQLFTRPVIRPIPYSTPDPQLFLCSSSTPPGGGVHGMCGVFAAKAALRRM